MARSAAAVAHAVQRAEIRHVKSTALGDYYVIDTNPQVMVRRSAQFPTTVCMTCLSVQCEHTAAVDEVAASPESFNG